MKKAIGVYLLWVAAVFTVAWTCNRDPVIKMVGPGESVQLQVVTPGSEWSVAEPGAGTVTQEGVYTAPACGAALPVTVHVIARKDTVVQTYTLTVKEVVKNVEIVCAHKVGATVCGPPNIEVQPGEQVQFYARVDYSCHSEFSPRRPPGF